MENNLSLFYSLKLRFSVTFNLIFILISEANALEIRQLSCHSGRVTLQNEEETTFQNVKNF